MAYKEPTLAQARTFIFLTAVFFVSLGVWITAGFGLACFTVGVLFFGFLVYNLSAEKEE